MLCTTPSAFSHSEKARLVALRMEPSLGAERTIIARACRKGHRVSDGDRVAKETGLPPAAAAELAGCVLQAVELVAQARELSATRRSVCGREERALLTAYEFLIPELRVVAF